MSEPSSGGDGGKGGIPTDAGAAGLGIGTFIAIVAEQMPDDADAKPWLLAFTPAITLGISLGWYKVRSWATDALDQRAANRIFTEAKQTLQDGLDNPSTSEAHKDELRKALEQLERDFINSKTARFRAKLR